MAAAVWVQDYCWLIKIQKCNNRLQPLHCFPIHMCINLPFFFHVIILVTGSNDFQSLCLIAELDNGS